jgi:hypothetical protein
MLSSWSHDVGHLYQPYEVHYETTKSSLSLSLSLSLFKIEFISPNFQEKFKDLFFTKTWQQIPQTPTQSNRIKKPKGKCIAIIRACEVLLVDEHR